MTSGPKEASAGSSAVNTDARAVAGRIAKILVDSGAYDASTKFVSIDVIWQTPSILSEFCNELVAFMRLIPRFQNLEAIVVGDSVQYPFGCIPIASLVSSLVGKPLVIWKESANIVTNESQTYGQIRGRKYMILHDVTRFGLTAVKIISDLKKLDGAVELVLTVVDTNAGASNFIKTRTKEVAAKAVEFRSIVLLSELESLAAKG